jgi:hypothetical protein
MKKYIKVTVNKTARQMGRNNDWSSYDKESYYFNNLKEAKKWLKDEYFYCKTRHKTFTDGIDGQTGWIYSFKSDGDCKHYEQHWINAYEIQSTPVLI